MFAKSEETLLKLWSNAANSRTPSAKIESESQLANRDLTLALLKKIGTLAIALLKKKLGEDFSYTQPQSLKIRVQNILQYVEHVDPHLMCVV